MCYLAYRNSVLYVMYAVIVNNGNLLDFLYILVEIKHTLFNTKHLGTYVGRYIHIY
jgi:hypothetical protein